MTLRRMGFVISEFLLVIGLALPLSSCGGGKGSSGSGGGSQYDYSVSLAPDKTSVAPGGTVNLNLHYDAPASNAGITWKMACLQTDCGSVSSNGIYTAPAKVDAQVVIGISATSNDKPTQGYYVEIWVTGKIVVQIMPNSLAGVHVNETIQFTSQVNSPDTVVTWQVNSITGGNATVGTISSSGLYTAPATVPTPDTVKVMAIAHVDSTASASVQLQIWPPLQVTVAVSPVDPSVNINATLQFTATVQNTSDTAVKWQVNGIDGGNSAIGTISSSGLFTAPAAVPSPSAETITAVSHADSTKSGTTHVGIVNLKNSLLNGPYTMEISGPDSSGYMRAAIGYLNFDGAGNFSAMLDLNFTTLTGGAQTATQFSGTYAVGQDNRGKMTFSFSPALTFVFTLNSMGSDAKLIEYDTRGTRYVGLMQKQTSTDLSLSKLVGDYAFSFYGVTGTNEREAAIGRFHADGSGGITDASMDIKEAGMDAQSLSNLSGSATMTDTTRGRGTVTFNQSATLQVHFSFYMTNAGDVFFLSNDPVPSDNPLLVGRALSQTGGPFTNASLDGPAVFGQWGDGYSGTSDSCLAVGQWTAVATTQRLTGIRDSQCNGIVTQSQALSGYYTISSNGRGAIGGISQMDDIFYMVSKNKAFLLNKTGIQNLTGMVEPQQVSTFNNSLFSGTYRIGPVSMPKPEADLSQGFLIADGLGYVTGTEDVLGDGLVSMTFTGTYSVDSTGRTLVNFTTPEPFHYVAYPVSATRFVGMSIEGNDNLANLTSLDQ